MEKSLISMDFLKTDPYEIAKKKEIFEMIETEVSLTMEIIC